MNSLFPWLGPIALLLLALNVVRQDGSHWAWGRFGMPEALLDASGTAFRDGTPVDPITLAMAASGYEQEAWLAAVAAAIAGLIWAVIAMIRRERDIRMDVMRRELRRFYGLPQEDTT